MHENIKGKQTTFKVTCTECSKDRELFPDGYFVSTKYHLKEGKKPCGCAKNHRWKSWQYLLRISRNLNGKDVQVCGFTENYKGKSTKIKLLCNIDKHTWITRADNVLNRSSGCPKCKYRELADRLKTKETVALERCVKICKTENYVPIGFVDGYKSAPSARFQYECPTHGVQTVRYIDFISKESRCPSCASHGYRPNKAGSFYIVKWSKDSHNFIKFGITNLKVKKRIEEQASKTHFNYEILYIKTWKDGRIAQYVESFIKRSKSLMRGVVLPEIFQDGFTETIEEKDLEILEDLFISALINLKLV
ncbi:hypothetical protein [Aeromonas phage 4L372D]|uniref:CapR homology domain-containing protein n=4 Tax=Plateaulakevirus TaxID=2843436 RepID=A0A5B9N7S6_9CAUD|nr:endonuclease [Aeromonas phage 2L372D]YP_009846429.1 endonuclease [Aeromonas phage 2L372X]YP_009846666.1 endonuclease [Aeromonas phage 4L372D]YP_009846897.1 endonuclease [Aeromonas phage 4L372XY]QDB74007.1 hypothetical protein 2L372D_093 [Aeromonas phage 2L372D]QEG08344.1 hypothetical protein [Aeromonas phage 2L372X]QEG08582.1 hypothetical protein [Aeromonas phage 4L372D]QEG08813.1 hypothetical protein [Aeromonas phage 4L372XY]